MTVTSQPVAVPASVELEVQRIRGLVQVPPLRGGGHRRRIVTHAVSREPGRAVPARRRTAAHGDGSRRPRHAPADMERYHRGEPSYQERATARRAQGCAARDRGVRTRGWDQSALPPLGMLEGLYKMW